MRKEILMFGDDETPFLRDVDIEKVLVSHKISFGEKNTLLVTCRMIVKLRHYIKCFLNKTKWMYFLIEDDDS